METPTITAKETVKKLYDAFGKGDIPFILEHVPENFTWFDPCDPSIVPFGGTHKNKTGFLEFFQQIGNSVDTNLWEVNDYIADEDKLVALGRHGIRCKKTGKEAVADWAMVWHFKDGEPSFGRSYYNTSVFENAFK
jgi:uncharacterized protein